MTKFYIADNGASIAEDDGDIYLFNPNANINHYAFKNAWAEIDENDKLQINVNTYYKLENKFKKHSVTLTAKQIGSLFYNGVHKLHCKLQTFYGFNSDWYFRSEESGRVELDHKKKASAFFTFEIISVGGKSFYSVHELMNPITLDYDEGSEPIPEYHSKSI